MDRQSLTPRERMTVMALRHTQEPLSLSQLMHETGFKSSQAFKTSLRFLATAGILVRSKNSTGEPVYACTPKKVGIES